MHSCRPIYPMIVLLVLLTACSNRNSSSTATTTSTGSQVISPTQASTLVDTGNAGIPGIELPKGFHISRYATGLNTPRFMTIGPKGALLVANSIANTVVAYPAGSTEQQAGNPTVVVQGLDDPTSLDMYGGNLYIGEASSVARVQLSNDLKAGPVTRIIMDLPSGGLHFTRTVLIGADKRIYVSIGSSCDVCQEQDPHHAAIWVYNLDGSHGQLYSKGMRNAVGLAVDPWTQSIWTTNNEANMMGNDTPPDTVNELAAGADFGWPRCHAGMIPDPQYGQGSNACQGVRQPLIRIQAHSAPLGLAFYPRTSAQFPAQYRSSLYVALHGSFYRTPSTGYKIVRIPLTNGNVSGPVQDFAIGWLNNSGDVSGRPVGITFAPDGSMFVSDDRQGVIYRIWYQA